MDEYRKEWIHGRVVDERKHGKRRDRMGRGKSPTTARKAWGCRYHLPTATPRCGTGQPFSLLLSMDLLALCRAGPSPQSIQPPSRIAQEGIQGQRTFSGQTELKKACLTNRNEGAAFQRQVLFWFFARRQARNFGKEEGRKRL